jgi:hypothetical protein
VVRPATPGRKSVSGYETIDSGATHSSIDRRQFEELTDASLQDDEWKRIEGLLPGRAGSVGVTAADNPLFVEAVLTESEAAPDCGFSQSMIAIPRTDGCSPLHRSLQQGRR